MNPALFVITLLMSLLAACGGADGSGTTNPPALPEPLPSPGGVNPAPSPLPAAPALILPRAAIEAAELAVIINEQDPVSVAVADYYVMRRNIPAQNVIRVSMPPTGANLDPEDFAPLIAQVEAALPAGIQAYALAWTQPYRVGCMSMTSAFAFGGYDDRYCNTSGGTCSVTADAATYNSDTTRPYDDHGIRPAMMLAGSSEAEVLALIDRGVAADGTFPDGDVYLVRTRDTARSGRFPDFQNTAAQWQSGKALRVNYLDNGNGLASDTVTSTADILLYQTGLVTVPGIDTNTYRPGAIADHLTSNGGNLTSAGGQMSALRWLEAGATASYGTVVEPCSYTPKFPQASVLLSHYYRGNTLLEAYWKSVHWPGEGVFVGEPLARPWGHGAARFENGNLIIETTWLKPGTTYAILAADNATGPFETVLDDIQVSEFQLATLVIPDANRAYYKLAAL